LLVADRPDRQGAADVVAAGLSTPEAGLTFSLLWRFDGTCGAARRPVAGGWSGGGARSGEQLGVGGVGLKWPNDILLEGGKVGGILVELDTAATQHAGGDRHRSQSADYLLTVTKSFIHRPAALAQVMAPVPDRQLLLAQLLTDLAEIMDRFEDGGFAALRNDWQAYHVWQGRQVRLLDGVLVDRQGLCLGADSDGALLLQTEAGIERCLSGDVSLRAA
jgi:BirA family biotin operon repressor/biotin-[acetyl-CoA-carboxylase] ligase